LGTADARLARFLDELHFGEAPRWHDERLYLSDISGGRVLVVDEEARATTVVELDGRPSGLGWLPDGRLIVVSMLDHRLLRLDDDGLVTVADLSPLCGGHANDMIVDSRGHAFIGNLGFEIEGIAPEDLDVRSTNLIRVDPDGSVHCAADDMWGPNGMALSEDERLLVVAEPAAARLTAFDVADDGSLTGRRVFATLADGAVPDGICLDAEGAVWMASPTTREFLRVQDGGAVLDRISTGDRIAIACVLGGEDRRTLFCITSESMGIDASAAEPRGRIEIAGVEVPGAGKP
jgi:sugar lactone lactonase YvrE